MMDGREASPSATEFLLSIADPPTVRDLIDEIRREDELAEEIAAESYPHLLGFDKYVLASCRHGHLRMHVWWPAQSRTSEDIHDHRFAFSSVVVTGRLRTELYEQHPDGEPLIRFDEHSRPGAHEWMFRRASPTGLRCAFEADLPPGSTYSQAAEIPHRVRAGNGLAVTIILQGRLVRSVSSVYLGPGRSKPRAQPRLIFSTAHLRDRFERLRDLL